MFFFCFLSSQKICTCKNNFYFSFNNVHNQNRLLTSFMIKQNGSSSTLDQFFSSFFFLDVVVERNYYSFFYNYSTIQYQYIFSISSSPYFIYEVSRINFLRLTMQYHMYLRKKKLTCMLQTNYKIVTISRFNNNNNNKTEKDRNL